MLQPSASQEALNALAEFQAYAATKLLVLDLIGTFVFALSGAVAGVKERLDLFGVLVLSFAAASAGGIMRDLLIGAVPPAAISDWRYLAVSLVAGLVVFFWYPISERVRNLRNHVMIFDAAGLALFAVVGTQKALGYKLNPIMAALLGVLTGIGGGMLRDVLVADVPAVLRSELYAVAALGGALVVVAGYVLNFPPTTMAVTGAALCFGIRLVAIQRGWRLPIAGFWQRSKVGRQREELKLRSRRTSMNTTNDDEPMDSSFRGTNFVRRLILSAVVLLVVFLAGLLPMWWKSRTYARERDAAQASLRISNLQNSLANAAIDARRGEYEPARQAASDFFTNLGTEVARGRDSVFNEAQRNALRTMFDTRDDTITLLARSDPSSADRLVDAYTKYRQAIVSAPPR